jgi:catechol 2,3-dioxygenase-like lactoylglutathione lyase family enzyme
MPLANLDHFFVYASDLEASRAFYERVLGLEVGERPPFPFPGYWLYLDGRPRVHLGTAQSSAGLDYYLGEREHARHEHTGSLDHIAFQALGFREFRAHLDGLGITYRHREVPQFSLQQLFIKDPDGVTLELNFPSEDA